MWIVFTLACAFVQALWMALSKRQLQKLPATRFMLYFRIPVVMALVPAFFFWPVPHVDARFWGIVLTAAAVECVRLVSFAKGAKTDYYATYSLKNTAPVFVLVLAPLVLEGERLTAAVLLGAACVVSGGFVFYRAGRLQLAGLISAVAQGTGTVLCKLGFLHCVRLGGSPIQFIAPMYLASMLMLLVVESVHTGVRDAAERVGSAGRRVVPLSGLTVAASVPSGLTSAVSGFRAEVWRILPISALNVAAVFTYVYGLHLSPGAMHFTIAFRMSLIFGFILSLVLLKEFDRWPAKLCGAGLILLGAIVITLA